MNTNNAAPTRIRISEEEVQPQQANRPRRKKPDAGVLRLLRFGMLLSGAVIVVLALTMLVLPMFKINKIVIEGNSYYDDEYVAQAAGIAVGDELFGWNMQDSCDALMAAYPYASDIYVTIQFFTVKIGIIEKPTVMYAEYQNQYISFDGTLRVLEMKTDGEEAFSPFLRVKLPAGFVAQVGYPIQFADGTTALSYLTELLTVLSDNGFLENVSYIDVSERFSLSFVLSDSVRVELGALRDMNIKLTLLKEQLNIHPTDHNIYAVVDVSNTSKPIWREIDAKNLFD